MQTKLLWVLGSLGGTALVAPSFGEAKSESASNTPPALGAPAISHGGSDTFGDNADPAFIATPPPKARAEIKTDSPGPKFIWVAGYYMPVKGEWKWLAGKWSLPPTVESVWIRGSYDAKAKHWSEAHWQPDGKPTPKAEPNDKGPAGK